MNDPQPTPTEFPKPIAIQRDGPSAIEISFDDGHVVHWTAAQLRDACPCATCCEKRQAKDQDASEPGGVPGHPVALPVLSAAEARPIGIASMQPVGQYGYNVKFSDGHASGIFLFKLLYRDDDADE